MSAPTSVRNPFTQGVMAFTGTATAIAATTAFAPVGVVGAGGWTLAWAVGLATVAWELGRPARDQTQVWSPFRALSGQAPRQRATARRFARGVPGR